MRIFTMAVLACILSLAANPAPDRTALDQIRAGNAAAGRGEFALAEAHFLAAEELTTDPGLVAFNRGVAAFRLKNWQDAEAGFTRALDDRASPAERRAKALYNRGVCLIYRGSAKPRGGSIELWAAIKSFEHCLASPATDAALQADARHNLEIAKLLWLEALAQEKKTPTPNEQPDPPLEPPPQPETRPPDQGPGSETPGQENGSQNPATLDPGSSAAKGQEPRKTDRRSPGKGNQPVVVGADALPPRTPAEVREFLKTQSERLAKERRSVAELVAPLERPNVKDW